MEEYYEIKRIVMDDYVDIHLIDPSDLKKHRLIRKYGNFKNDINFRIQVENLIMYFVYELGFDWI